MDEVWCANKVKGGSVRVMTKPSQGCRPVPARRARRRLAWIVAVVLAPMVPTGTLSAQVVEGVLLDRDSGAPIELGLVALLTPEGDSVAAALTNRAGRFTLEADVGGDFLLTASALGYRSTLASSVLELGDGGRMTLEFRLQAIPIDIGGIVVDVESSWLDQPGLVQNGFVARAQTGMGRFLSPGDIEESTAYTTTELLTTTGRVMSQYQIGGDRILMRGRLGLCSPFVYVDGLRVSTGGGLSLDAYVPIQVVDAVEVYRSPVEAPPQFAAGLWGCGVIVIWTKNG